MGTAQIISISRINTANRVLQWVVVSDIYIAFVKIGFFLTIVQTTYSLHEIINTWTISVIAQYYRVRSNLVYVQWRRHYWQLD